MNVDKELITNKEGLIFGTIYDRVHGVFPK